MGEELLLGRVDGGGRDAGVEPGAAVDEDEPELGVGRVGGGRGKRPGKAEVESVEVAVVRVRDVGMVLGPRPGDGGDHDGEIDLVKSVGRFLKSRAAPFGQL
nr:hypothetical protein CFP56_00875 [Quercus suber]